MTWAGFDRIRPVGRRAFVVDVASAADARALEALLRANPVLGQVDLIAGECSVLILLGRGVVQGAIVEHLAQLRIGARADLEGKIVEIPTQYSGDDLATVAALLGITVAEVIVAHSAQLWRAEFNGFMPGFTYLAGENSSLLVPRRQTPRTQVPSGSVAIADRFSAIYPRRSPGGWQLLGHTDAAIWDSTREPPALIKPGDEVRFVPIPSPRRLRAKRAETLKDPDTLPTGLLVVATGLQMLVEDRGRRGLRGQSVSPSGAADMASYMIGNELVGNERGAGSLEIAFGNAQFETRGTQVMAITGAQLSAEVSGLDRTPRSIEGWTPFVMEHGERLTLGAPSAGVLTYLSVRGGIAVASELGSRSTDLLSQIGPAAVSAGDVVPVGLAPVAPVELSALVRRMPQPDDTIDVIIDFGPRDDVFTEESRAALLSVSWKVGADSNRVGMRLRGEPVLAMIEPGALPSEGILAGSIQVPSSGQPVVFLRDHPVTGGYPVIAVAREESLNDLAQLGPSNRVRFRLGEQE